MTSKSAARPAIAVTGLQKSFGDKVVLDGIDLNVEEGTIFALLGPNGAGKTTTVHILSTLIPADGGKVQVAGLQRRDHGLRPGCHRRVRLRACLKPGWAEQHVPAYQFRYRRSVSGEIEPGRQEHLAGAARAGPVSRDDFDRDPVPRCLRDRRATRQRP